VPLPDPTRQFIFASRNVLVRDRNVVHLEKVLAADEEVRLRRILQIPKYRDMYFAGGFLFHMGRQAIRAGAWKCMNEMMSACCMTTKLLVSFFDALSASIETKLIAGGDVVVRLTDMYPDPSSSMSHSVMVVERFQYAWNERKACSTRNYAKPLADFHRVCNILATATNFKGNPLHLDRSTMCEFVGPRLACLLLASDETQQDRVANDLVRAHLSHREWMALATRNAHMADRWLPFLPSVEHLWAAAIRLLRVAHDVKLHVSQAVLYAAIRRHNLLVSELEKEVVVHLIPDLAKIVTSYFQLEALSTRQDIDDTAWLDVEDIAWLVSHTQRESVLQTYFPWTTRERCAQRKAQRRKARAAAGMSTPLVDPLPSP
jgi:hypothetical protein